jgi:replicative DNA helicase
MKALTNPQNAGKDGAGLNKGQLIKIKQSADNLREKQLLISDEPGMSMDYIIAQSEAEAELGKVDAIVVDYVQLIQGTRLHGENREQELSRYSKELKQLAKKLKCVVISPVQLNDDGRIRESRSISFDADVVLFIADNGVRVDKWRNAQRDQLLPLELNGSIQRFENTNQP